MILNFPSNKLAKEKFVPYELANIWRCRRHCRLCISIAIADDDDDEILSLKQWLARKSARQIAKVILPHSQFSVCVWSWRPSCHDNLLTQLKWCQMLVQIRLSRISLYQVKYPKCINIYIHLFIYLSVGWWWWVKLQWYCITSFKLVSYFAHGEWILVPLYSWW